MALASAFLDMVSMLPACEKRKKAEEALRESEERFRRALRIDTIGVLFFDIEAAGSPKPTTRS